MKLTQAFRMALSAIWSNKLRSFLTMLGIIIGIVAVTMLIGVGQGTTSDVTEQIKGMGSNLLTANITNTRRLTLYEKDMDQLASETNGLIEFIAPVVTANESVKFERNVTDASIMGTTPNFVSVRNYGLSSGRFLAQSDLDGRGTVAVIGSEIADTLYGTQNAAGNKIVISGKTFTVVGVLEAMGTSMSGSNDTTVIIPFTTAARMFSNTVIRTFYASSYNESDIDAAKTAIESFLAARETGGDTSAYRVYSQTDLLETVSSVSDSLTLMLAGIAGISLLVGGIGIMNIMLVSVTERTREIGIRKAIGAQRFDIICQFMIESLVLSILGGLIGLGLSFGGAQLVGRFAGLKVVMSQAVSLMAIGFSAAVGLIFGIYPAAKAARFRPIEALRYE